MTAAPPKARKKGKPAAEPAPANGQPASTVRTVEYPYPRAVLKLKDDPGADALLDLIQRYAETGGKDAALCDQIVESVRSTGPLTVAQAKGLLGWEEESEAVKFGDEFALRDYYGVKIRLHKNLGNRPLTRSWAETIAQEILNRRWRFNGESIVIGRTGLDLSAQHRLVGFVLAGQMWAAQDAAGEHWRSLWPEEPTIECVVVTGVEESDDVTRTLDNVKPRTLADVLFTSATFAKIPTARREALCRMTDYCVRMLWQRTGAGLDAFTPRRTHSEALDFIERHPHVLEAVKHVFEENEGTKAGSDKRGFLGRYGISPGYMAAYLYLMGSCESDTEKYRSAVPPSEKKGVSWKQWDLACNFIVDLFKGTFKAVRNALGALMNDDEDGQKVNPSDKLAVIVKAWVAYRDKGSVEPEDVELEYRWEVDPKAASDLEEDDSFVGDDGNLVVVASAETVGNRTTVTKRDGGTLEFKGTEALPVRNGIRSLVDRHASFGGLDLGDGKAESLPGETPDADVDERVTPETVEAEKERILAEKVNGGVHAPTDEEEKALRKAENGKLLKAKAEAKKAGQDPATVTSVEEKSDGGKAPPKARKKKETV